MKGVGVELWGWVDGGWEVTLPDASEWRQLNRLK